jgi:riboflavin synthase
LFTGIIEETGRIKSVKKGSNSAVLQIESNMMKRDIKVGDSIATNGVCLTVTGINPDSFFANVMHETLMRSSLGHLKPSDVVNIERAMPLNGRFDGHIVSGHIDGIGTITNMRKDDIAIWYTIQTSAKIMRYIIEKGSIALDGISLTIANITKNTFQVSVIPHTVNVTNLSKKRIGDVVNLENDLIGKYVEKFLDHKTTITHSFLKEHEF